MGPEAALLRAIEADPDDVDPQLVIADWLLAHGDPRGELIVLDQRQRTGQLADPEGIERLLMLAAEYTFPCAREPEEPVLPFARGNGLPAQYELAYEGRRYEIWAQQSTFMVDVYDRDGIVARHMFGATSGDWMDFVDEKRWNDDEAAAALAVFSDAIRYDTPFEPLRFPHHQAPPPAYDGGSRRIYRLPASACERWGVDKDRYGLAARDYVRWNWLWNVLVS
jgi:uncharacterized protein (TIGR02996 family)